MSYIHTSVGITDANNVCISLNITSSVYMSDLKRQFLEIDLNYGHLEPITCWAIEILSGHLFERIGIDLNCQFVINCQHFIRYGSESNIKDKTTIIKHNSIKLVDLRYRIKFNNRIITSHDMGIKLSLNMHFEDFKTATLR